MPFPRPVVSAILMALCQSLPVAAQEAGPLELSGTRLHEELRSDALISGNWLVGAHMLAGRSAEAPSLHSYVPGGPFWQGQPLCARATDKEGRYSALFEYTVPETWSGGLVSLRYESDFGDHVAHIDESNSGIALHRGACQSVTDTFLPVLWNARETPQIDADGNLRLILNLNAGRADSLIPRATLTADDGVATPLPITCAATEAAGVAFNYQCEATAPGDRRGVVEIEIVRLRYGRKSPPRVAQIHLFPADGN